MLLIFVQPHLYLVDLRFFIFRTISELVKIFIKVFRDHVQLVPSMLWHL